MIPPCSPSLSVKLASLVVHVQEAEETSEPFDHAAAIALARDPEVLGWLGQFGPGLLPAKRAEAHDADA